MNRFSVIWATEARNHLASIWLQVRDRQAVADAADRIDRVLSENADLIEDDYYGDRFLEVPPLAVVFRVSVEDRIAQVIRVWHWNVRSP